MEEKIQLCKGKKMFVKKCWEIVFFDTYDLYLGDTLLEECHLLKVTRQP